jgi:predicted protein tyrosine phosphatase
VTVPLKILFVCGRNERRSPTAEKLFRNDARLAVRSAGVSDSSRRKVREPDLAWADLILVMEGRHAARLRAAFGHPLPPLISLGIPDDFEFMDPELVELLQGAVEGVLAERAEERGESPSA